MSALLAVGERPGLLAHQHPQVARDDGHGSPELVDGERQEFRRLGGRAREGWHLGSRRPTGRKAAAKERTDKSVLNRDSSLGSD